YDANGNLTTDETGKQLVYDAWNRLVTVKNSGGTTIAAYSYDPAGRRISSTENGTTTELYYSNQWQVLEERVSGSASAQSVWSPVYIDALVLRDRSVTGTLDERLWVQQDANWSVTAVVSIAGSVLEREVYDPFGAATFLSSSWNALGSSSYAWN